MSCCNSNFDGFNDLEELEVSPYLDFDGEDQSIDADFDYLFGKKAKARRKARREERRASGSPLIQNLKGNTLGSGKRQERIEDKAKATTDIEDCLRNRPRGTGFKRWKSACNIAHPNTLSAGSNPAVDDTPADNSGSGSSSGASRRPIVGDALKKIGEEFGMPSNIGAGAGASASAEPMEEPQKAGILANKGLMIAGGVILLGLGIFAIRKFRN